MDRIWRIARLEMITSLRVRAWLGIGIMASVAATIATAVNYFLVTRMSGGMSTRWGAAITYIIVGLAMRSLVQVAESSPVSILQTSYSDGVLRRAVVSRMPAYAVIVGRALPQFGSGINYALLYGAVGVVFFSLRVDFRGLPLALAVMLLGLAACFGLGLCLTFLFFSSSALRAFGQPVSVLLSLVFCTLSGVLYPIEILPSKVQAVALLLPQTHCYRAVRHLLLGHDFSAVAHDLLFLTFFALVALPLGFYIMARGVNAIRRQGYAPRVGRLIFW